MTLLVLGVLLWAVAHFFKRAVPGVREPMGDKGKGMVALALLVSVVLMVVGYRAAEVTDVLWSTPSFAKHINNLVVLIAIFMMSPAPRKGRLLNGVRHPMLIGFSLWAAAHIWVNPDMPSLVLFGGLLAWAILEIVVINRAEGPWKPTENGTIAKDGMFFVASVILMGVIGFIHGLVGPSPFGA
ncbi:putative membrane protein [Shimia isoporae]|uniref:Putative membrane protein n=1 Tax=Shimia isoporae TaxID=647720 RepID=A0A4R1NPH3_9RHOB|nr:NnrU family protein [Shimia isoporae]TCL08543.1 putative membrane protein [Shimia isoporae]